MTNHWKSQHTLSVLLVLAAAALAVFLLWQNRAAWAPANLLLALWAAMAAAIALVTLIAGAGLTGRFFTGWLLNEQNRLSLAQLQMGLWTLLVLSAFLAAAFANIFAGHVEDALAIAVPQELWWVMGIATTALVGSPLILAPKKAQTTNVAVAARTLARQGVARQDDITMDDVAQNFDGQVERNPTAADASLGDLVRGEQAGNASVLSMSRLQNLFFTLVLLVVYAVAIGATFTAEYAGKLEIRAFPALNQAFTVLLGISTVGYLGAKSVNQQAEGGEADAAALSVAGPEPAAAALGAARATAAR